MSLPPGTRLGPYEVLAPIGAGGMGEVYRARDTRLDRTVALKVIADSTASPDARARFEREARAVAVLNHPHICTLHDVGRDAGTEYLVMEMLDGETLAERLARGALPLEQAFKDSVEIADALAAAHRLGIVHRDLKPGNIMLTKAGVKLLDFGLAKLHSTDASGPERPVSSPTVASLTGDYAILGTVQYMAPEQLEGKPTDHRSDLFAFGAVLYEMVTGRRAFAGDSTASVIGAILKDEPAPLTSLQPVAPASLERLVRRCLAKDPNERWQSAKDLGEELKWLAASRAESVATHGQRSPGGDQVGASHSRSWLPWAVTAAIAIAAAATWLWPRDARMEQASDTPRPSVRRLLIPLPDGTQLAGHGRLALVPDGSAIVVALTNAAGNSQLYRRRLDGLDFTPIDGSDGGVDAFVSPDGRQVGFSMRGKVYRLPLEGGTPTAVHDAPHPHGAVWFDNQSLVFPPNSGGAGLWRVKADGTDFSQVAAADTVRFAEWPDIVRSTGDLVYARQQADDLSDAAHIVQKPLGAGKERLLVDGGYGPTATESGHLLFVRGGALYAVALDARSGDPIGEPAKVAQGLSSNSGNGGTSYAVSSEGTLVYQAGSDAGQRRRLVWIDRQGVESKFVEERHDYMFADISPDGSRVAVYTRGARAWIADTRRSTIVAFRGSRIAPLWTSDGRSLTLSRFLAAGSDYSTEVSVRSIDGGEPERTLFVIPSRVYLNQWSPDRKWLLVTQVKPGSGDNAVAIAADTGEQLPIADSRFEENGAQFSPDGRWVAYASNESGRPEIYVVPFGQPGEKVQVSSRGGQRPIWSADRRELFYRNPGEVFAVDVSIGTSFRASQPRLLFKSEFANDGWDVMPDGQHFLMIKQDAAPNEPLVVVEHFFDELERLAPHPKR